MARRPIAYTPTLVPGLSDVVGVAAGDTHSLAWTSGGNVYAWGANNYGQLGDGSKTQRVSPVLISTLSGVTQLVAGDFHSMAVTSGGAVYAWGGNTYGQIGDNGALTDRTSPVLISALSNITAVGGGTAAQSGRDLHRCGVYVGAEPPQSAWRWHADGSQDPGPSHRSLRHRPRHGRMDA